MFVHLPIVITAMLSPLAVSDTVPKFDIVSGCRFEGGQSLNSTAAQRTKVLPFGSFKRRGRNSPAPTKGIALPPRRSAASQATSNS